MRNGCQSDGEAKAETDAEVSMVVQVKADAKHRPMRCGCQSGGEAKAETDAKVSMMVQAKAEAKH